ncbi:MAG: sigma 54-interacting transcriptional regulator [Deltaproteobacteria bacterium]|jgi:PAS domain S-box-containing protein|nr:sigma 54-interacting transcriptional regulator [Deltaproteobacteria bacterium]MBT4268212.1 sigma 54-interacting transcriptional regulator [Deltaproteobacteria bacterium]MBT4640159.1 sigma 54-interacting transcriptional regulator [Deltaproteobacteria bacterium]MBT6500694.1 sigma 54-interacting transcriptional regulator [Deltaproteobacteria bacterium]MBT6614237.1 sigma 54-interacting transcriptional regulator [Deltaproteobacteria bacterium]
MIEKSKKDKISWNTTETILESISDGVFTVDQDWIIMSFNRSAEAITGVPRDEAIGRHCWEVFRSSKCEKDCALRQTMQNGKDVNSYSAYIINSEKKKIPIGISTSLLKNEKGEVLGGVETFRDLSLVEELRKELDNRFQMGDMVSRSSLMKKIFQILPQVAESDSTILIQGETGTGKELLARAIHSLSRRKDEPFVAINCGALPDTLLESELFGHKAGAFTHAINNKLGHFAAAEKGSILLDEIGDTSSAFQVRLLRVLQEKEYCPLGSVKPIHSDVRVIAATNRDLSELVETGAFRPDLFYRINVVLLKLPPLRDRKEDIPLLVENFITRMNILRDRTIDGMDRDAMGALMSHDFPGNIRELENIIERAFILCQDGIILPKHLPSELAMKAYRSGSLSPLEDALESMEAQTILAAFKRNHYNRLATAADLGIHKSTLFRKIKKLGISLPIIK